MNFSNKPKFGFTEPVLIKPQNRVEPRMIAIQKLQTNLRLKYEACTSTDNIVYIPRDINHIHN